MSFLLLALSTLSAASDIDKHLRDQYQGKTLVLRGFYGGNFLRYDSTGTPAGSNTGDWTIDGLVRVDEVRISGGQLNIRATRVHLGWVAGDLQTLHDKVGPLAKDEKKDRDLRIEAALGPGPVSIESTDAVLSRIFLASQDSFVDLLPGYWQPCVREGLAAQAENKNPCHFSPDFLAIPGVVSNSNPPKSPDSADLDSSPDSEQIPLSRVGGGVSPPRVIQQRDPEFSESARRAKFQGVVTLKLVVDASGNPTKIRILAPLGSGLDERAIGAVSGWKFKPAEKDGKPVAVEIAVEVDFHLY